MKSLKSGKGSNSRAFSRWCGSLVETMLIKRWKNVGWNGMCLVDLHSLKKEAMTSIYNNKELHTALRAKEDTILVFDDKVGNPLLIAGRVQTGKFPRVVLDRLTSGGSCKVSVGNGIIIPVTQEVAKETVEMLDMLDEHHIELDIEEVAPQQKINLYYGE